MKSVHPWMLSDTLLYKFHTDLFNSLSSIYTALQCQGQQIVFMSFACFSVHSCTEQYLW